MTINDKLFAIGLFVIFCTVTIGGVFTSQVAAVWLKNKNEQRRHYERRLEIRCSEKWDTERKTWMKMLDERDQEIKTLKDELSRLSTNYAISKKLMDGAKLKGED